MTKRKEPESSLLQLLFNWLHVNLITNNFKLSTQHARTLSSSLLKNTCCSPFPAFNPKRWTGPVTIDTVQYNAPAIYNGSSCAKLFVHTKNIVADVYGMKADKKFVNTLEDNIRKRGATDKLMSDNSQSEIHNRVKDILRSLLIDNWQSEPH